MQGSTGLMVQHEPWRRVSEASAIYCCMHETETVSNQACSWLRVMHQRCRLQEFSPLKKLKQRVERFWINVTQFRMQREFAACAASFAVLTRVRKLARVV